ncbi:PREDICTED: centrosomal protein of 192 kDa [Thamnophis sirtalis]|uniref:Centrosomal protein of 192 kDa n=1 Tax=Thamnophis sirtalis TaxID=35019 RepID=A0A6I9Y908_9SAUR|nr:PREDICTED: centrosomal protein of 192 kDa [Thamnophis sirtalis]
MEDFKHIGDETFPSVSVNSIANHTNEILDNITLSSNLGLPVAASTETRQKTGSQSRLSDHASYIERKFLATLASSCGDELDSDPRKNLMSNFHDTVENCDYTAEIILEPPQKCLQRRQSQNSTDDCLDKNPNSFHEKHLEAASGFSDSLPSNYLTSQSFPVKSKQICPLASWGMLQKVW